VGVQIAFETGGDRAWQQDVVWHLVGSMVGRWGWRCGREEIAGCLRCVLGLQSLGAMRRADPQIQNK